MASPASGAEAGPFASAHPGSEAVVMPIGAHTAQLIVVAPSGEWARSVVASVGSAVALCEQLGIPCHTGWPDDVRRRAASYRRSPAAWARAPYPERRARSRVRGDRAGVHQVEEKRA